MTIRDSTGPSWLYATAMEHSVQWNYNFSQASDITTIITQTESPYWQNPVTCWAMNLESVSGLQMYGSGWYNWFQGNQTALFRAVNTTGNCFCLNVHGTNMFVVGDVNIKAYTPIEEEWFCDGPMLVSIFLCLPLLCVCCMFTPLTFLSLHTFAGVSWGKCKKKNVSISYSSTYHILSLAPRLAVGL